LSEEHVAFNQEVTPLVLKKLRSQAFFLTHDPDDAKDLMQITLLRAWRSWRQYEPGSNCGAWLCMIMRNLHINNYRKKSKSLNKVNINYEDLEKGYEKFVVPPNMELSFDGPFSDEVMGALGKLQEKYQVMIVLRHFEGYSYKEIVESLGCPIGTVRSNLHRAKEALKLLLADYAKEKYNIAI